MSEQWSSDQTGARVSLREVGARAGVSFQTASKVLRGKGTVADATRVRVHAAAAELGYIPNSLARSLATQRTHSIGFIASGLASFVLAPMLLGAERVAREQGYFVLFNFVSEDRVADGVSILHQLIERRVDGIVSAASTFQDDAEYSALLRQSVPSVATHTVVGKPGPVIGEDSEATGFLGTHHLIQSGHRRIATITGTTYGKSIRGRLAGYAGALGEANIAFSPELIEVGNWTVEGGYRAMQRLLDGPEEITAVVAQNDHMALGVMRASQERGLRVPEDISIVGCDDVDFARFTNPPLTTVRLSFESTGAQAVQLLLDMLRGQEVVPNRIVLPCSLIVRESTCKRQ